MTILRVGSTDKYADNWSEAFGESAPKAKAAKTSVTKAAAKVAEKASAIVSKASAKAKKSAKKRKK